MEDAEKTKEQLVRELAELRQQMKKSQELHHRLDQARLQLMLSQEMAMLANLTAGISYGITNPISTLSSIYDTLNRAMNKLKVTLETEIPQKYQNSRNFATARQVIDEADRVIQKGSEQLVTLVRNLRRFAQEDEATLSQVDIHEGLEAVLMMLQEELRKSRVEVVKKYGDIPPVVCYPSRLIQVFLNILINAIQAIEGRGTITIATFLQDDEIHVAIQDTGSGISEENLKKIFDPGFTTKPAGSGTGLGLPVCSQIIRQHKGHIKAESQVDEGSTFTVILSMAQKQNRQSI